MEQNYEKRGYLLEDFRLFHLKDKAGAEVDFHYHDFCKVLLLISGSGGYNVEGQRYNLQAGDVVLIGNRCVHRPEFPAGLPYERIIIYIDPAFLRRHSMDDCDLEAVFSGAEGHVLRTDDFSRRRLMALAEALEREMAIEEYGRVLVSRSQLLQLIVEIARSLRRSNSNRPAPIVPSDERILELLEYIDAHLDEELSVEQLAERAYLSKFHFMRKFKAETGQSLHEYISQRRLLLARALIGQGENVTEVCFKTGFRSYSSFFRAYVKLFGVTPTGKAERAARESSYE